MKGEMYGVREFSEKRMEIIHQLENGHLTKEEFIDENYAFIESLNIKTMNYNVRDFEEGLFKYHYYNVLAKKHLMWASECEYKDPRKSYHHVQKAYSAYEKKDVVLLRLLEAASYQDVEGYYIQMNSKGLDGEIFEIVFKKLDSVILHSKSKKIKNKLVKNNVFHESVKKSLIDSYVNTKL